MSAVLPPSCSSICVKCGREAFELDRFCRKCGEVLPPFRIAIPASLEDQIVSCRLLLIELLENDRCLIPNHLRRRAEELANKEAH